MKQLLQFLFDLLDRLSDSAKTWFDGISGLVVVTTLAQWLPALAALASLVWTGLRIYEWFEKRRKAKQAPLSTGPADAATRKPDGIQS